MYNTTVDYTRYNLTGLQIPTNYNEISIINKHVVFNKYKYLIFIAIRCDILQITDTFSITEFYE